jgi:hypothetical protein
MTSSTAEMIYGGVPSKGFEGLSESPLGDSSSWKAFSTDLRKKNVDIMLKGVIRRADIFRLSADLVKNSGIVRAASAGVLGSWMISMHVQT